MNSVITRKVEDVFRDFKGRRAGVIKALTTEADDLYRQCDPGKGILCLYGFPNETWEVNLPDDYVPPDIPEPVVGINFARDGMQKKDWLSFVAVHGDTWLLSVAFYLAARFGFDKFSRERLFNKINELPTVFDIVTGVINKRAKEKSSATNVSSKKEEEEKEEEEEEEEDSEEEEDDQDEVCGKCNEYYSLDDIWIYCDVCERSFHGKCVKVTGAEAMNMKRYSCPSCSSKRSPA